MNKMGKFIDPSPFAASGAARCGPEAGQPHVDFQVAFLPKIRASMNVKDQMKNTKWWYSVYFKIDFILHLTFGLWHFSTFGNGACSGTVGFDFTCDYPGTRSRAIACNLGL
ncbi:hypothetical protein [Desulfosarcina ovata]|uniref:hypothetical protein n=1 Tax=Desulfosarcina ovata TaxID=83564 RepID=UPI0012D2E727|nr:hypothetical protein [Desulfosarcina ovata]